MITAYTDNYARLLATPDAPATVGTWLDPRDRGRHIYERSMTEFPMTVRSIALSIGMDIVPLEDAWRLRRDRYPFHKHLDTAEGDSNPLAMENYQGFLTLALGVLEERVRPYFGAWGQLPGVIGNAVRVPGFQLVPEQAILNALRYRPDGIVEIIAAWMVVMAATPEEVDEAVQRRQVALSGKPEPIRELERTVDHIVELWYLPPRRHRRLRNVELLVVRLEIPMIPDPDQPAHYPTAAARLRPRSNGSAHVTILGGPRDGEQIASFLCTGNDYLIDTARAIRQLNRTGTLPPIDASDEPDGNG